MMKEEEGNLKRKCKQEKIVTYYSISVPSCIHVSTQNTSYFVFPFIDWQLSYPHVERNRKINGVVVCPV